MWALPLYEMQYLRLHISKAKRARKSKLSTFVDRITLYITLERYWAQGESRWLQAAQKVVRNAQNSEISHLANV